MDILIWIGVFIASLAVLLKAAAVFTKTAEKIGLHFKIPPFLIGVTIIALGTSLPELATSISSVFHGHSEIVLGNVVGSNMANILLIIAVAAIVGRHLYVDKDIIRIDLPILLGSTILLFFTTLDGQYNYLDAILSLLVLVTYVIYNVKSNRKVDPKEQKDLKKLGKEEKAEEKKDPLHFKYYFYLLLSGTFLYLGSEYTIQAVIAISDTLNIAKELIAISAVAIGTSLPELAVSVVAAKSGKADIAIGNIIGSNIFNSLGVMGIPALFGSLVIPPEMLSFSVPALVLVTILYIFVTMDREISQWEGITLLMIYIAFMGKIFGLI